MKYQNKTISLFFLFLFLFFTSSASANNWYASGSVGLNTLGDSEPDLTVYGSTFPVKMDFDTGVNFGGALGYKFRKIRMEFEISFRSNDINNFEAIGTTFVVPLDISSTTYLLNSFYDFESQGKFTPYIGAGLGFSNIDFSGLDDTVFAFKLIGGGSYKINSNLDLTAEYSYLGAQDADLDFFTGVSYDTHNFNVGFRYSF